VWKSHLLYSYHTHFWEDAFHAGSALQNQGLYTHLLYKPVWATRILPLGNSSFFPRVATEGKAQVWGHVLEGVREPLSESHLENWVSSYFEVGKKKKNWGIVVVSIFIKARKANCRMLFHSIIASWELFLSATTTYNLFSSVIVSFFPPAITKRSCGKVRAIDFLKSCWQLQETFTFQMHSTHFSYIFPGS